MDALAIRQSVHKFLEKHISNEFKDSDDIFANRFVGSLFAMQIVNFLEREFDISIEGDDIDISNFRSIDTICDFIVRKIKDR